MGPEHAKLLAQALGRILGAPVDGMVAFVRCLSSEQVDALADAAEFTLSGWTVNAVIDVAGSRRITADQAVEHREDKADSALLLIDPLRAGAGLDGIYSAGREIGESELFGKAIELARKPFWGRMGFLDTAAKRAERLGSRRRLTPWSRFDFTVCAANEGEGRSLAKLGLWPVQSDGTPSDAEMEMSAALADRVLYAGDSKSVSERVRSLLLDDPEVYEPLLERWLRKSGGRSPEETANALADEPKLWLGPLSPGFASQSLRRISLVSWRDSKNAVLKWSGLTKPEGSDQIPRLVLDRDAPVKDRAQLGVRWTTDPDDLPTGTVEYRVTVTAGEDVLAELVVSHRDTNRQQISIGLGDFNELEGSEKFEALVHVTAIGVENVEPVMTEPFLLEFGRLAKELSTASGQLVRSLVEGAVSCSARSRFEELIGGPNAVSHPEEDKKSFINWKGETSGRGARVFRPALIRQMEEDWQRRGAPVGRWVQVVSADGSPIGALDFVTLGQDGGVGLDRVQEACRKLANEVGRTGLLGRVLSIGWAAADNYVNAWEKALDAGSPDLALHGTIEVRTQAGRIVGMLVTPLHPVRFAWQTLYDQAVVHARYEQGLTSAAVIKAVAPIDSANFPFALPGTGDTRGFLFGEVLGFHTVAMTVDGETEPKAAAALLSACLYGEARGVGSSSDGSAAVIGREIQHYLDCYGGNGGEYPDILNVQAWRSGDGQTVARALGYALKAQGESDEQGEASPLCFTLDLYHAKDSTTSGRFLTTLGGRRRTGNQDLEAQDRWMTDTAVRPGGVLVPRLRWSKRVELAANDDDGWTGSRTSHLSLAFDLFESRLDVAPAASLGEPRPLHVWGLIRAVERRAVDGDNPAWITFAPPELTGESAPEGRTAGDRLRRIDRAIGRATTRALGGGPNDWPVLRTRLSADDRMRLERLHERSDWVITLDRNAGLDYLDAPNRASEIYERFVIDAVPDRADLSAMKLVTSTSNLDAVRDLVNEALSSMGLSASKRNSRFLIGHLKSLSGRLAIRLADGGTRTGELIALALMHANCAAHAKQTDTWPSLEQGVLIPVDEIASHAPIVAMASEDGEPALRADFIHVSAPPRGPMEFRFIEVKYRQYLRTARQPEMLAHMVAQTGKLRQRWMNWFFGDDLAPLDRVVRRSQLARLLRFYVDRAVRHRLSDRGYARLSTEIDQLLIKETYQKGDVDQPDFGYVFCPEHRTGSTEPLYAEHDCRLWLFGPAMLPDDDSQVGNRFLTSAVGAELDDLPEAAEISALGDSLPSVLTGPAGDGREAGEAREALPLAYASRIEETSQSFESAVELPSPLDATVYIGLGETATGARVDWTPSIRSNPHLMMVGLPGMGKTTALINICKQLTSAGITPIIFSYHDDIDEKLNAAIGGMRVIDFDGLGFNPLRVDRTGPTAHIDVAGTVRDIFASIFPDLGEIQLEELRAAIRQSYDDLGWSAQGENRPPSPAFRTFLENLRSRAKPNQNLLARLQELDDYGFFNHGDAESGLLADSRPTLVRVHLSTNDIVQRAFAGFVLYSIYKDMFRRGVQDRLTHAVIFDEAHRAAKLKLIPRLAKECRKYGLALALASQGVRDFDPGLFEAIANYLVFRVTEPDARTLAKNTASTADQQRITDRLKALEPYVALFFSAASSKPLMVRLTG